MCPVVVPDAAIAREHNISMAGGSISCALVPAAKVPITCIQMHHRLARLYWIDQHAGTSFEFFAEYHTYILRYILHTRVYQVT